MKKFFLITITLLAFLAAGVQAQDYTLTPVGKVTKVLDDTIASAATTSVTILLTTAAQQAAAWSLQVLGTSLSGTMEGWVDVYKSNDGSNWELVTARVTNDTIISGNTIAWRSDTDGYDARYLRLLITNKTQTQSTRYRAWFYAYKP